MADPTTSDRDQPLVVVSSDTHIGPRLREDLRPYCPAQHLDAFDAAVTGNAGALIALGKAFADETDPDTDRGVVFRRNWQTEGHHDITARLRDMDYDGIAAEVIFHGSQNSEIIPFQATPRSSASSPTTSSSRPLGLHIYNAWLADYCSHEPARHVGLVHLPWWDLDAAIAELQWAREAGLRSVNFPRPAPTCRRTTAASGSRSGRRVPTSTCRSPPTRAPVIRRAGAARRRCASSHSRVAVGPPAARDALHDPRRGVRAAPEPPARAHRAARRLVDEHRSTTSTPRTSRPSTPLASPSRPRAARVSTRARTCSSGRASSRAYEAEHAVRDGYTRQVMWGSDYPHMEGTFQYPRSFDEPSVGRMAMRYTFAGLPDDAIRDMAGENAVRVYGLDRDELAKVAARIGAPTLTGARHAARRRPRGRQRAGVPHRRRLELGSERFAAELVDHAQVARRTLSDPR